MCARALVALARTRTEHRTVVAQNTCARPLPAHRAEPRCRATAGWLGWDGWDGWDGLAGLGCEAGLWVRAADRGWSGWASSPGGRGASHGDLAARLGWLAQSGPAGCEASHTAGRQPSWPPQASSLVKDKNRAGGQEGRKARHPHRTLLENYIDSPPWQKMGVRIRQLSPEGDPPR
jgi:hypothetical protein